MLCIGDLSCTRGQKYETVRFKSSSLKSIGCVKLIDEVLILGASGEDRQGRGILVQEVQNVRSCGRLSFVWLRLIIIGPPYCTFVMLTSWRVEF